ncbi:hypothetical protein FRC09_007073 [Ceratobasidium sp. 395]|nr:hypothetical protein FRC09_007073 [Ceratobasidium sp. 395]
MGRYNGQSAQPKHGAASLMAKLSESLSLTESDAPTSQSMQSTLTSTASMQCFFCPRTFGDDSTRRRHIIDTPACLAAQRAVLERATARLAAQQSARSDAPDASAPARKRQKVTVEEVQDPDGPGPTSPRLPTGEPPTNTGPPLPAGPEPAEPA